MSLTHEALLRAEAKHDAVYSKTHDQLDSERKLLQLKLGREDLANQSLPELIQSLHAINKCLEEPSIAFEMDSEHSSPGSNDIPRVLLKRKWLVLELIDTIITEKNDAKIRSVISQVQNTNIQKTVKKYLSFLYRKNEILKKEFRSIAALDKEDPAAIDASEEKAVALSASGAKSLDQEKEARNTSKSQSRPGFLPIVVIISLLAFWGAAIVLTHFLDLSIAAVWEYAVLLSIGFLLGVLLGTTQRNRSTKKGDRIS